MSPSFTFEDKEVDIVMVTFGGISQKMAGRDESRDNKSMTFFSRGVFSFLQLEMEKKKSEICQPHQVDRPIGLKRHAVCSLIEHEENFMRSHQQGNKMQGCGTARILCVESWSHVSKKKKEFLLISTDTISPAITWKDPSMSLKRRFPSPHPIVQHFVEKVHKTPRSFQCFSFKKKAEKRR